MAIKLTGWNDFYSGWLAELFGVSDDENQSAEWRMGWKMANETGSMKALALIPEIKQGHIKLEIIGDEGAIPGAAGNNAQQPHGETN